MVHSLISKWVRETMHLTWADMIHVQQPEPWGNQGTYVSIDLDRMHYAQTKSGKTYYVPWGREKGINNARGLYGMGDAIPLILPYVHGTDIYLPYSDSLWEGLNEVEKVIQAAKETLHELLISEQGQDTLTDVGADILGLALPSGE